jgi:hypothetical protein
MPAIDGSRFIAVQVATVTRECNQVCHGDDPLPAVAAQYRSGRDSDQFTTPIWRTPWGRLTARPKAETIR